MAIPLIERKVQKMCRAERREWKRIDMRRRSHCLSECVLLFVLLLPSVRPLSMSQSRLPLAVVSVPVGKRVFAWPLLQVRHILSLVFAPCICICLSCSHLNGCCHLNVRHLTHRWVCSSTCPCPRATRQPSPPHTWASQLCAIRMRLQFIPIGPQFPQFLALLHLPLFPTCLHSATSSLHIHHIHLT